MVEAVRARTARRQSALDLDERGQLHSPRAALSSGTSDQAQGSCCSFSVTAEEMTSHYYAVPSGLLSMGHGHTSAYAC